MNVTKYFAKDLFKGKVVFVTGGGSGINLGVAQAFAALGADLGICGRTQERLDNAAKSLRDLGARVVTAVADVRDFSALYKAFESSREQFGPMDVLVCGAAGNFIAPAEKLSPNGFKSVVDIDLLGSFNAARAAFEQLKTTRGNIIFISAGMSYIPYYGQSHVGAAKAGVDNLMRNLALEWGPYGIRSNSICPGPIEDTEGMRRLAPGELGDKLAKTMPLQRFGRVEDIGQAAVFLASPLAGYITGTHLIVDGGSILPGSGLFSQLIMEQLARRKKES